MLISEFIFLIKPWSELINAVTCCFYFSNIKEFLLTAALLLLKFLNKIAFLVLHCSTKHLEFVCPICADCG